VTLPSALPDLSFRAVCLYEILWPMKLRKHSKIQKQTHARTLKVEKLKWFLSLLYYFSFIGYKIYTSAFCSATRKDQIIEAWEGCSAHLFVHQNVAFLKLLNIPQQNLILCALHLVLKEFNFCEYSFKTTLCMKPKLDCHRNELWQCFGFLHRVMCCLFWHFGETVSIFGVTVSPEEV